MLDRVYTVMNNRGYLSQIGPLATEPADEQELCGNCMDASTKNLSYENTDNKYRFPSSQRQTSINCRQINVG